MTGYLVADHGADAPRSGWKVDVATAGVITVFVVGVTAHLSHTEGEPLDAFAYVLLVLAGGAMACCRRWPRSTALFVTLVVGVYLLRRYVDGPVYATAWLSLLALSLLTSRRAALALATPLSVGLSLAAFWPDGSLLPAVFVGWSAAAVFLGDALRTRRAHLIDLEERALHLERTREEETRRRIAEERLRIARDLHDGVAHAMSTISVQAGAAAHVAEQQPAAAKDALDAIQRASGNVLDELTAMLSVLHDDAAVRAPTPGFERIPQLAETAGGSGLEVRLAMDGDSELVPPAVGTAAYRIVQESLTNVLRHAGAATVEVRIRVGDDGSLDVDVRDDGAGNGNGQDSTGTGIGIQGMRSRAETTGGRFEAGPGVAGGFRVHASWEGRK